MSDSGDDKSSTTCDYAHLPHSGGGTNHGPATHALRGYNICDKCYDAIRAAEEQEAELYRAQPSPLLSHECGQNMRCRVCGSLPIVVSSKASLSPQTLTEAEESLELADKFDAALGDATILSLVRQHRETIARALRSTIAVSATASSSPRIQQLERELAFRNQQYDDLWADIQRAALVAVRDSAPPGPKDTLERCPRGTCGVRIPNCPKCSKPPHDPLAMDGDFP